jgi:acyl-CoA thioesterase FadM
MSGLLRNLLTLIFAAWRMGTTRLSGSVSTWFWVSPFDTGVATLKSDKYFQLVEAAQLDFGLQTGLSRALLQRKASFVNAAQNLRFIRPIRVFQQVRVNTTIAYFDDKCVYFVHDFYVKDALCAQALVKSKFKHGAVTVAPAQFLGACVTEKPAQLQHWDTALASPSEPRD